MSLYTRMYKILENEFGQLPNEGVLAGQAVAEAFFRAGKINITSRMKDLDWFVNSNDNVENVRGHFSTNLSPAVKVNIPSYDADLSVGGIVKHGLYTVITSDVINGGRINRVLIRKPHISDPVTTMEVLNGFDINCTACALDLQTKQVVQHPAFDVFCKSLEIDFISLHTPLSSLVRVFEKKDYIAGTTINMGKLFSVVKAAVWSRYCSDYTSFEESELKAPKEYKKGTGMSIPRFESLGESARNMLEEHFNRHSVTLFDDGVLYAFTPKDEPNKISALTRVLGADVNVASYSLDLMCKITHMTTEDFYETVIWPLKESELRSHYSTSTRMVRGFLQGALLKGFFDSHSALSFKEIAGMLNSNLIYSTIETGSMDEDRGVLFSDMICRVLESYIDSTSTVDATSNAINCICKSFQSWGDQVRDISIFISFPWFDRSAFIDTLIERVFRGESIPSIITEALNKPIKPVVDIKSITFGLSADREDELMLRYSVKLASCLKEVVGKESLSITSLNATLLIVDYEHDGFCSQFIAEVIWSEYEAKYKVSVRHLIGEKKEFNDSAIDAVSLHIQTTINQSTRYSMKRLKALSPMIKDKVARFNREVKELFTQENALSEVERKFRYELHVPNKHALNNSDWDDDLHFRERQN